MTSRRQYLMVFYCRTPSRVVLRLRGDLAGVHAAPHVDHVDGDAELGVTIHMIDVWRGMHTSKIPA